MYKTIEFTITKEQAEKICNYSDANIEELSDTEICILLDKIIEELY